MYYTNAENIGLLKKNAVLARECLDNFAIGCRWDSSFKHSGALFDITNKKSKAGLLLPIYDK